MSNYTQEQQTEIVHDAMTLTSAIQVEQSELEKVRKERFRSRPVEPTRKVLTVPQIQPQIPAPPVSNLKYSDYVKKLATKKRVIVFCVAFLILCFIYKLTDNPVGIAMLFFYLIPGSIVFLIVTYVLYSDKKKQMNQAYARSPEYLQAVENAKQYAAKRQREVNEETAQKQAQLDAEYQSDLEHYQTVVLPEYEKARQDWNDLRAKKIEVLEEDLRLNRETLENLYETTRQISVHYRELWILRWLYDDMRSSDHDIRYATELLDRDRQRLVTEQAGRMVNEALSEVQSVMMTGFSAVYSAIEDGNDAVQNELSKVHSSLKLSNAANAVGIYQRHKKNKMMKEQNKMLSE